MNHSVNQTNVVNDTFSPIIEMAHHYHNWIINHFSPYIKGDLLEVGVGHGSFYSLVEPLVDNYAGIDNNADSIKSVQKKYPHLSYFHADINDTALTDKLNNKRFDCILCCNVLEHIENDQLALSNMLSLLKDDGHLLLFVPAFPALYSDLDGLAGHYRRYTKPAMRALIPQDSARAVQLRYFNSIGGVGWWCNKWIGHASLESKLMEKQIMLFDKVIVPFAKFADFFTHGFFGQSLLCVIEKRTLTRGDDIISEG